MKQLVKVEEVPCEGFAALLGKQVVVWSMNYFYTGKLVGVNDTFIKLEDAAVVYETGKLTADLKTKEKLPEGTPLYCQISAVECFYEKK